jgi:serine protease
VGRGLPWLLSGSPAQVAQQASGQITVGDGALRLGGSTLTSGFFAGTLDDMRIYNRALNGGEISSDMTTPVDGGGTGNARPTAVMAVDSVGLTCTFDGSGSSDTGGVIVDHAWILGDGTTASGATVSHTYASAGAYRVELAVTDDGGVTGADAVDVVVTADTAPIALAVTGYKVKGVQQADLQWSGAAGQVEVTRDGAVVATVGTTYSDNIGQRGGGSRTYRVCETGSSRCSNDVTVQF